ncbi:MAG TPA: cytochrome c3 family protein [Anaerolineae bacterium]
MSQIFHPSTNTFSKASIFGAVFIVAGLAAVWALFIRSSYATGVNLVREQPIPFSHEHHVSGLGIDCRYCHYPVENAPFAGIPATEICMHCHSQIWADSPVLEPVRQSFRTGEPLIWNRVHDLGDFTYFNHSIHVQKGVACVTCHGRVDQMPLVRQTETLYMEWCLECHRNVEQYIRPPEFVFDMEWEPPADQVALGRELIEEHGIVVEQLTDCNICHN